jgi:hypothetical protein
MVRPHVGNLSLVYVLLACCVECNVTAVQFACSVLLCRILCRLLGLHDFI